MGKLIAVPFPRKRRQPVALELPRGLLEEFEQLVGEVAERLGETPQQARRAVEITVLRRGIKAVREGNRKR